MNISKVHEPFEHRLVVFEMRRIDLCQLRNIKYHVSALSSLDFAIHKHI